MENLVKNCPDGVFRMDVTITSEYTDETGCVTPGALARLMQDVTETHMSKSGLQGNEFFVKGVVDGEVSFQVKMDFAE